MKRTYIMEIVHDMIIAGTQKVVWDIITNLHGGKYNFSVVCIDRIGEMGEELKRKGVPVYCLNRTPGIDYGLILRLKRFIDKESPDIIHCHQYTPYFYGALAVFFSRARPKIIFTEHGRHQPDRRKWKRILFNKLFLNKVTEEITGVSEFTKRSLAVYEGFPYGRIKVIYNGITGHKRRNNRDALRKDMGYNGKDILIGHIGRLHPVKGQRYLLDAFKIVSKEVPSARLLIAGDGPIRKELEQYAHNLSLNSSVRFAGVIPDIWPLLEAIDIFVLPSIAEAASVTLLEAMSAARPVIVTDAGGNPEIVKDRQNGILVPVRNASAIASEIIKLVQSKDKREKLGRNAAETINSRFRLTDTIASYDKLFSLRS